jgi:hypothetical protein
MMIFRQGVTKPLVWQGSGIHVAPDETLVASSEHRPAFTILTNGVASSLADFARAGLNKLR